MKIIQQIATQDPYCGVRSLEFVVDDYQALFKLLLMPILIIKQNSEKIGEGNQCMMWNPA